MSTLLPEAIQGVSKLLWKRSILPVSDAMDANAHAREKLSQGLSKAALLGLAQLKARVHVKQVRLGVPNQKVPLLRLPKRQHRRLCHHRFSFHLWNRNKLLELLHQVRRALLSGHNLACKLVHRHLKFLVPKDLRLNLLSLLPPLELHVHLAHHRIEVHHVVLAVNVDGAEIHLQRRQRLDHVIRLPLLLRCQVLVKRKLHELGQLMLRQPEQLGHGLDSHAALLCPLRHGLDHTLVHMWQLQEASLTHLGLRGLHASGTILGCQHPRPLDVRGNRLGDALEVLDHSFSGNEPTIVQPSDSRHRSNFDKLSHQLWQSRLQHLVLLEGRVTWYPIHVSKKREVHSHKLHFLLVHLFPLLDGLAADQRPHQVFQVRERLLRNGHFRKLRGTRESLEHPVDAVRLPDVHRTRGVPPQTNRVDVQVVGRVLLRLVQVVDRDADWNENGNGNDACK
mmetsp:Transcript_9672/g.18186  ORF Transcript_9672/g.18186 Transcript_9672/m.18186 type:complete len:451 (+) Transcript_9672:3709-5061(+)